MLSSPSTPTPETKANESEHYIIAIGASAGGLEAIQEFFDNMPANGTLSFIIIQHLSPDYKSLLVELLSKHTNMKVVEAQHEMEVNPSMVYVIPNDKLLTIEGSKLQLSEKQIAKAPNTAIDIFLHSLAEAQAEKAIAIILSGTGSDGSKGIRSIHEAGGMVLVQDPATAKFDGMPNSAIAAGVVDYIIAPELMPEEIFVYIKEKPERLATADKPDEQYLPEIMKLVENSCSYDFTNYKTPTILRRIGKRMAQLNYRKFQDYLQLLRSSRQECKMLGKEFLIGVTKFFRDHAAFDLIEKKVLEPLIKEKSHGDVLKVWVTACSTGEEAYSIAILIDKLLKKLQKALEVKIFATDLDMDAIEFASRGSYPILSVSEMDDDTIHTYFSQQEGVVTIVPHIRKQIVFARHNVLKDPPFIKNDLVTCRNMLIYMNNILQRRVCATLQFALNKGGYLFLGPSEVPGSIKENLLEIDGKWKIYSKIANELRFNPERMPSAQNYRSERERKPPPRESTLSRDLVDEFQGLLSDEFNYAAVYVDKNFDVKEATGNYRKFLTLPEKSFNTHLLKMVTPQVAAVLTSTLRKVIKNGNPASLRNVRSANGDADKTVNIYIKPSQREELVLLVFSDGAPPATKDLDTVVAPPSEGSAAYIFELEEELRETRSNLQMAVESLETANEELQSSNEELLSANEELQSGNEELQSLNEELHTLNTEHQLRIKELIELNDDLNNYFRSTNIAQVFVDSNLRIRKFNPAAVEMINLIETDIGRPLEHISNNIQYPEFYGEVKKVFAEGIEIEKEVQTGENKFLMMRLLPYIRRDREHDGVVISFFDISLLKKKDNIIKAVFNTSGSAILALESVYKKGQLSDFVITQTNSPAALLMPGAEDHVGSRLKEAFPELLNVISLAEFEEILVSGQKLQKEILLSPDKQKTWYLAIATRMPNGIAITLTDINSKKIAEEKFRKNFQELLVVKENYRSLNLALEDKIKERTYELTQSEERFRLIADTTSDAVWDWDIASNTMWWSHNFYTQFGFGDNAQTNHGSFWLSRVHESDRTRVQQELQEAINSGAAIWKTRFRFLKQNGKLATILMKGALLIDSNNTPYRMVGAMIDVTEAEWASEMLKLKNDELQTVLSEFRFVTDFMPQMVWATKADGYHDFFNKGWYDFTGLTYDQTKDQGWSLVLHPDDFQRTLEVWTNCLRTGEVYEIEYRMRRHDGVYRWFLARALPLRNEEGEIQKWFGTCTDIHDQKLSSDLLEIKVQERTSELQQANAELEASNAELLQFASVASHDLKEPLRKIHMFANMINDRYLQQNEAAAQYMERIIASSARMTRLINDLLDFTRLSVNSSFEPTDLNQVMDEVLSDLEVAIKEKDAVIKVSELPKAEIIPGQFRQVFQNLVSNGLKFTKPGCRPEIVVSCQLVETCSVDAPVSDDGKFCKISITDNGIGFSESYAGKIFTIFQRLHSQERYEGTGIGLAIAKKIMEKHGGLITAFGKEGEGASFVIIFPLEQNPD